MKTHFTSLVELAERESFQTLQRTITCLEGMRKKDPHGFQISFLEESNIFVSMPGKADLKTNGQKRTAKAERHKQLVSICAAQVSAWACLEA